MIVTTRYLVGPAELHRADGSELYTFSNVADAVDFLDRARTPGLQVYVCEPLAESGLWEWTFTRPGETEPPENRLYVNERAARASAWDGCTIWKARAGQTPLRWQRADPTE